MHNRKKILALEGEWADSISHPESVQPALQALQQCGSIDYVYRRVARREDFFFYLEQASRSDDFAIIYLGGHGSKNSLQLGDSENCLTLEDIAEGAGDLLKGKMLHISSCGVLNVKQAAIEAFKLKTGVRFLSGYTSGSIDFIDSMLLDMAFFYRLQDYQKVGYLKNTMPVHYPGLCERLGFVMY